MVELHLLKVSRGVVRCPMQGRTCPAFANAARACPSPYSSPVTALTVAARGSPISSARSPK